MHLNPGSPLYQLEDCEDLLILSVHPFPEMEVLTPT